MQSSQVRNVDLPSTSGPKVKNKDLPPWAKDSKIFPLDFFTTNRSHIIKSTKAYIRELSQWRTRSTPDLRQVKAVLRRIMMFLHDFATYIDSKMQLESEMEEQLISLLSMYMNLELRYLNALKRDSLNLNETQSSCSNISGPDATSQSATDIVICGNTVDAQTVVRYEQILVNRFSHCIYILLPSHEQRVDALLCITVYTKSTRPVLDPIFRKILSEMPCGPFSSVSYVRHMLAFKTWRERCLVADDDESRTLCSFIEQHLKPLELKTFPEPLLQCLGSGSTFREFTRPYNVNLRHECKHFISFCRELPAVADQINLESISEGISLLDDDVLYVEENQVSELMNMISHRKMRRLAAADDVIDLTETNRHQVTCDVIDLTEEDDFKKTFRGGGSRNIVPQSTLSDLFSPATYSPREWTLFHDWRPSSCRSPEPPAPSTFVILAEESATRQQFPNNRCVEASPEPSAHVAGASLCLETLENKLNTPNTSTTTIDNTAQAQQDGDKPVDATTSDEQTCNNAPPEEVDDVDEFCDNMLSGGDDDTNRTCTLEFKSANDIHGSVVQTMDSEQCARNTINEQTMCVEISPYAIDTTNRLQTEEEEEEEVVVVVETTDEKNVNREHTPETLDKRKSPEPLETRSVILQLCNELEVITTAADDYIEKPTEETHKLIIEEPADQFIENEEIIIETQEEVKTIEQIPSIIETNNDKLIPTKPKKGKGRRAQDSNVNRKRKSTDKKELTVKRKRTSIEEQQQINMFDDQRKQTDLQLNPEDITEESTNKENLEGINKTDDIKTVNATQRKGRRKQLELLLDCERSKDPIDHLKYQENETDDSPSINITQRKGRRKVVNTPKIDDPKEEEVNKIITTKRGRKKSIDASETELKYDDENKEIATTSNNVIAQRNSRRKSIDEATQQIEIKTERRPRRPQIDKIVTHEQQHVDVIKSKKSKPKKIVTTKSLDETTDVLKDDSEKLPNASIVELDDDKPKRRRKQNFKDAIRDDDKTTASNKHPETIKDKELFIYLRHLPKDYEEKITSKSNSDSIQIETCEENVPETVANTSESKEVPQHVLKEKKSRGRPAKNRKFKFFPNNSTDEIRKEKKSESDDDMPLNVRLCEKVTKPDENREKKRPQSKNKWSQSVASFLDEGPCNFTKNKSKTDNKKYDIRPSSSSFKEKLKQFVFQPKEDQEKSTIIIKPSPIKKSNLKSPSKDEDIKIIYSPRSDSKPKKLKSVNFNLENEVESPRKSRKNKTNIKQNRKKNLNNIFPKENPKELPLIVTKSTNSNYGFVPRTVLDDHIEKTTMAEYVNTERKTEQTKLNTTEKPVTPTHSICAHPKKLYSRKAQMQLIEMQKEEQSSSTNSTDSKDSKDQNSTSNLIVEQVNEIAYQKTPEINQQQEIETEIVEITETRELNNSSSSEQTDSQPNEIEFYSKNEETLLENRVVEISIPEDSQNIDSEILDIIAIEEIPNEEKSTLVEEDATKENTEILDVVATDLDTSNVYETETTVEVVATEQILFDIPPSLEINVTTENTQEPDVSSFIETEVTTNNHKLSVEEIETDISENAVDVQFGKIDENITVVPCNNQLGDKIFENKFDCNFDEGNSNSALVIDTVNNTENAAVNMIGVIETIKNNQLSDTESVAAAAATASIGNRFLADLLMGATETLDVHLEVVEDCDVHEQEHEYLEMLIEPQRISIPVVVSSPVVSETYVTFKGNFGEIKNVTAKEKIDTSSTKDHKCVVNRLEFHCPLQMNLNNGMLNTTEELATSVDPTAAATAALTVESGEWPLLTKSMTPAVFKINKVEENNLFMLADIAIEQYKTENNNSIPGGLVENIQINELDVVRTQNAFEYDIGGAHLVIQTQRTADNNVKLENTIQVITNRANAKNVPLPTNRNNGNTVHNLLNELEECIKESEIASTNGNGNANKEEDKSNNFLITDEINTNANVYKIDIPYTAELQLTPDLDDDFIIHRQVEQLVVAQPPLKKSPPKVEYSKIETLIGHNDDHKESIKSKYQPEKNNEMNIRKKTSQLLDKYKNERDKQSKTDAQINDKKSNRFIRSTRPMRMVTVKRKNNVDVVALKKAEIEKAFDELCKQNETKPNLEVDNFKENPVNSTDKTVAPNNLQKLTNDKESIVANETLQIAPDLDKSTENVQDSIKQSKNVAHPNNLQNKAASETLQVCPDLDKSTDNTKNVKDTIQQSENAVNFPESADVDKSTESVQDSFKQTENAVNFLVSAHPNNLQNKAANETLQVTPDLDESADKTENIKDTVQQSEHDAVNFPDSVAPNNLQNPTNEKESIAANETLQIAPDLNKSTDNMESVKDTIQQSQNAVNFPESTDLDKSTENVQDSIKHSENDVNFPVAAHPNNLPNLTNDKELIAANETLQIAPDLDKSTEIVKDTIQQSENVVSFLDSTASNNLPNQTNEKELIAVENSVRFPDSADSNNLPKQTNLNECITTDLDKSADSAEQNHSLFTKTENSKINSILNCVEPSKEIRSKKLSKNIIDKVTSETVEEFEEQSYNSKNLNVVDIEEKQIIDNKLESTNNKTTKLSKRKRIKQTDSQINDIKKADHEKTLETEVIKMNTGNHLIIENHRLSNIILSCSETARELRLSRRQRNRSIIDKDSEDKIVASEKAFDDLLKEHKQTLKNAPKEKDEDTETTITLEEQSNVNIIENKSLIIDSTKELRTPRRKRNQNIIDTEEDYLKSNINDLQIEKQLNVEMIDSGKENLSQEFVQKDNVDPSKGSKTLRRKRNKSIIDDKKVGNDKIFNELLEEHKKTISIKEETNDFREIVKDNLNRKLTKNDNKSSVVSNFSDLPKDLRTLKRKRNRTIIDKDFDDKKVTTEKIFDELVEEYKQTLRKTPQEDPETITEETENLRTSKRKRNKDIINIDLVDNKIANEKIFNALLEEHKKTLTHKEKESKRNEQESVEIGNVSEDSSNEMQITNKNEKIFDNKPVEEQQKMYLLNKLETDNQQFKMESTNHKKSRKRNRIPIENNTKMNKKSTIETTEDEIPLTVVGFSDQIKRTDYLEKQNSVESVDLVSLQGNISTQNTEVLSKEKESETTNNYNDQSDERSVNRIEVVQNWINNRIDNRVDSDPDTYETIEECNYFDESSNNSLSSPNMGDDQDQTKKPEKEKVFDNNQTPDSGISMTNDDDSVQKHRTPDHENLFDTTFITDNVQQEIQITENDNNLIVRIPLLKIEDDTLPFIKEKMAGKEILENPHKRSHDDDGVSDEKDEENVKRTKTVLEESDSQDDVPSDSIPYDSKQCDNENPTFRSKGSVKAFPPLLSSLIDIPLRPSCSFSSPYPSEISLSEETNFYVEGIDLYKDIPCYESLESFLEQESYHNDISPDVPQKTETQQVLQPDYCSADNQFLTLPEYMNFYNLVNMNQVQPEMKSHSTEEQQKRNEFEDCETEEPVISGIIDGICNNSYLFAEQTANEFKVSVYETNQETSEVQVLITDVTDTYLYEEDVPLQMEVVTNIPETDTIEQSTPTITTIVPQDSQVNAEPAVFNSATPEMGSETLQNSNTNVITVAETTQSNVMDVNIPPVPKPEENKSPKIMKDKTFTVDFGQVPETNITDGHKKTNYKRDVPKCKYEPKPASTSSPKIQTLNLHSKMNLSKSQECAKKSTVLPTRSKPKLPPPPPQIVKKPDQRKYEFSKPIQHRPSSNPSVSNPRLERRYSDPKIQNPIHRSGGGCASQPYQIINSETIKSQKTIPKQNDTSSSHKYFEDFIPPHLIEKIIGGSTKTENGRRNSERVDNYYYNSQQRRSQFEHGNRSATQSDPGYRSSSDNSRHGHGHGHRNFYKNDMTKQDDRSRNWFKNNQLQNLLQEYEAKKKFSNK